MKKAGLLLLLTLSLGNLRAQTGNAGPDDYADIFKKPLFVEVVDTNARPKAGTTVYPQKDLSSLIRAAVEDLWKVNAKVEFQTQDIMSKNLSKGDGKGIYMYLSKHPYSSKENEVWVLTYSRGDKAKEGKPDYEIYLPSISSRTVKAWNAQDIRFVITLMQENMKHNQKTGDRLTPADYMYVEAVKNCGQLKANNVLIDGSLLDKNVDDKVLRKSMKKVNHTLASADQMLSLVESNPDTLALLIVYPRGFTSLNSDAFGAKYVNYQKVIVKVSDYRVLGAVGKGRRDNPLITVEEGDLKALITCEKK